MLFVLKKEQIEHARLRALAQAVISKDKGKEAFDEYMKVAFPWLATTKRREKDDHLKVLFAEVKKGGLSIKPLWEEKMRSRLKHRVVERDAPPPPKTRDEMNQLYAKLGKIVPV
jgi:hypothetical protein